MRPGQTTRSNHLAPAPQLSDTARLWCRVLVSRGFAVRHILLSISALLISVAILLLGGGLLGTLLSVRMTLEAFDPTITGLVMSAYFFGLMLGAQQAARVIRRAGHIRAFAVFAVITNAAVLGHGLYLDPYLWAALRVLTGFSIAGLYMVIESWLNERATSETRGRIFSVYQVIAYTALGGGQLLLYVGDPSGPDLFMVSALLLGLALIPVSITRAEHPKPPEHHRMALRATLGHSPLAGIATVGSGLINGAIFAMTPVFGLATGIGVDGIALLMAAIIFGGVLLQWPIGQLSDRLGRRPVLAAVGAGTAIVAVTLAVADFLPLTLLIPVAAMFGGVSFTLYPLSVSHANDVLQPKDFVSVSGTLLFFWGLGATVGPTAAGQVMAYTGPRGLFLFVAGVATLIALAAWLLRAEEVPVDAQEAPFVPVARTTPVISELDPRYDEAEFAAPPGDDTPPEWDAERPDEERWSG